MTSKENIHTIEDFDKRMINLKEEFMELSKQFNESHNEDNQTYEDNMTISHLRSTTNEIDHDLSEMCSLGKTSREITSSIRKSKCEPKERKDALCQMLISACGDRKSVV